MVPKHQRCTQHWHGNAAVEDTLPCAADHQRMERRTLPRRLRLETIRLGAQPSLRAAHQYRRGHGSHDADPQHSDA